MGRKRRVVRRSLVPVAVDEAISYVDTICVNLPVGMKKEAFRDLRVGLLEALRPNRGRYLPKKMFRTDGKWFWTVFVHQPTIAALDVLQRSTSPFRITQVHVSLDLLPTDLRQALTLQRYIESRLVVTKRPSARSVHVDDCTTYFGKGARRGSEVVLYSDRRSKAEQTRACLHIDWRIKGAEALRAASLSTPTDVVELNHRRFWDERLLLWRAPSPGDLLAARQREVKRQFPEYAEDARKIKRQVNVSLRAASGPDLDIIATDLLYFMNQNRWIYGDRPSRLFLREPHQWMLPCELNAMWR
jgi:hypothetical protein